MTAEREERKVVTVVFADLVGFTARAEALDPEDVRQILRPYHAHVRDELERHGGTVEKFIGDAVMGVFGAPQAHEDDPERAVRAALAIRDWAREQEVFELRVAVNTGEALVSLDASAAAGEALVAGDVVNTAARMQAAAPVNGVIVGETTERATRQAIDYRPASPIEAKGKGMSIAVWEALEARARFGVDVRLEPRSPLVGRQRELELLSAALERARREREPQLVTLVGVPGIGKTRLVYELFQLADRDPELMFWRQGRSLPYGDGVSFWALGEMIKSQAGILETDDPERAADKLAETVRDLVPESDAEWIERQLRASIGLGEGEAREETFAASRRFFEALAEQRPLVLVFEDLHWADESLLDFIDELVELSSGVPLLVVGTARPELLARRPDWGGGKANALTLSLSSLSDSETAILVHALLERSVLDADVQAMLLERAGGNPLYAEEFVRLAAEDPDAAHGALPETVHGLIAARLDALEHDEKSLLHDASVIGKVFWPGAVETLGDRGREDVARVLRALARKEFVRRERRSSVEGEDEYAFRHALVRDVAYSQIPRAERGQRHLAAAAWIESLGRAKDHLEPLAHHYLAALELTRASGTESPDLVERARVVFREAGDRAFDVGATAAAIRFYGTALELWPEGSTARLELLFLRGRAAFVHDETGEEDLLAAAEGSAEHNNEELEANARAVLSTMCWRQSRGDEARLHNHRVKELAERLPASAAKAHVLMRLSGWYMVEELYEDAIRSGRSAAGLGEQFGLASVVGNALNNVGMSRLASGDLDGIDDLARAVRVLEDANSPALNRIYGHLAEAHQELAELERAEEWAIRGWHEIERRDSVPGRRWFRAEQAMRRYWTGDWDEAAALATEAIEEFEHAAHWLEPVCRGVRALIGFVRDDVGAALDDAERALRAARAQPDPQTFLPALAVHAHLLAEAGDRAAAAAVIDELLSVWPARPLHVRSNCAFPLAPTLAALGRGDEFAEIADRSPLQTPWLEAARALAAGDGRTAAAVYEGIGARAPEAYARLVLARSLRPAEADAELRSALAFFRSVGAVRYVRAGEALLPASA